MSAYSLGLGEQTETMHLSSCRRGYYRSLRASCNISHLSTRPCGRDPWSCESSPPDAQHPQVLPSRQTAVASPHCPKAVLTPGQHGTCLPALDWQSGSCKFVLEISRRGFVATHKIRLEQDQACAVKTSTLCGLSASCTGTIWICCRRQHGSTPATGPALLGLQGGEVSTTWPTRRI